MRPRAFLIHGQELHYTEDPVRPVTTLLESIWDQYPDQARSITRNRIQHTQPLTPSCQGMIKVVAKRASLISEDEVGSMLQQLSISHKAVEHFPVTKFLKSPISLPIEAISNEEAMDLARELSKVSDRGVGAILLGPDQKILSYGWNDHFKNRVNHAEVMAIRNHLHLHQKSIPKKSTLIVTLQPCAMCAGYLHAFSEDFHSLQIIYEVIDPGPFAQNSILIEGSDLHCKSGLIGVPQIQKF